MAANNDSNKKDKEKDKNPVNVTYSNTEVNPEAKPSKDGQTAEVASENGFPGTRGNTFEGLIDESKFSEINAQIINAEDNYSYLHTLSLKADGQQDLCFGASRLNFELPNYGVEDYIADRNRWLKGATALGSEVGWFYFKVLFKFNTNYGLLGGVASDRLNHQFGSTSTALRYLWSLKDYYNQENLKYRIIALYKFVGMLMEISQKYPWCIKGINNIGSAFDVVLNEFSKEKSIDLLLNLEATDMKLSTLLDLYKYICYDDINCKEILPENLRKFDMSIIFFHVPIKYFQTGIMVQPKTNLQSGLFGSHTFMGKAEAIIEKAYNFLANSIKYYKYKRMHPENGYDFSNMMSFKMLTFNNCEIDTSSFSKFYENAEINNEKPFNLGNSSIKIKYDRVYYHNMNEWNQFLFGSDGFYYNATMPESILFNLGDPKNSGGIINVATDIESGKTKNNWQERLKSIKEARESKPFFDENAQQYKEMIEYSEFFINDGLMNMGFDDYMQWCSGNLFGGKTKIGSNYWSEKQKALVHGLVEDGSNIYGEDINEIKDDYYKNKLKDLVKGEVDGNIYGKDYGPNSNDSNYFKDKITELNERSIYGNLYGFIFGKSFEEAKYFLEKKKILADNKIDLGNIYGYQFGPKELSEKIKLFNKNTLNSSNIVTHSNNVFSMLGKPNSLKNNPITISQYLTNPNEYAISDPVSISVNNNVTNATNAIERPVNNRRNNSNKKVPRQITYIKLKPQPKPDNQYSKPTDDTPFGSLRNTLGQIGAFFGI